MAIPRIHPSNFIYFIICVFGVVAFLLVGILPNSMAMGRLEKAIAELNEKVQAQELLYPVYRQLIKEVQQQVPASLPLPKSGKIAHNGLSQINDVFMEVAQQSDVTFESAAPDASSYLEESQRLIMNVTFSGDFFNFRKLLFGISRLPYLESIAKMTIETGSQEKTIEVKLVLIQE